MSDWKLILLKCGWDVSQQEPPFLARQIAEYAADHIEQLQTRLDNWDKCYQSYLDDESSYPSFPPPDDK